MSMFDGRYHKQVRNRRNPVGKFTVFHGDHGITPEQKEWIKNTLFKEAPQGFFIIQVNIPSELGTVKNALYGPAAGDAPVPESLVSYRPRGDRPWADRVIDLPTRQVDYVQTIGQRTGDDFELWTIFGGPNAPRNPGDPQNPDPEGSRKWWSQHALSLEQWK